MTVPYHEIPNETVELDEDEFWEKYKPLAAPDGGTIFNTTKEAFAFAEERMSDINFIWTVSDGDDGYGAYCTPGVHMGGFGFCVTESPWEHENICGTWMDADEQLRKDIEFEEWNNSIALFGRSPL